LIYQTHIHPWLEDNETHIEEFIASAHERLKTAGITYLKQAIELLKTKVLGLPPGEPSVNAVPEPTAGPQSYTQALLARFSVPSARWTGTGSTGTDFYNLLASAVSAATSAGIGAPSSGSGTATGTQDMTASGTLIPPNIRGATEKMTFIAAQRERLNIVLNALDREATELQRSEGGRASSMTFDGNSDENETQRPASGLSGFSGLSGLSKSRSEADFEKIDAESGAEDEGAVRRRGGNTPSNGGGSWMPWGWGSSATPTPESTGRSSAFEKKQSD
jgi:receptor expression-enhancing protein 1/2/3/4